MSTRIIRLNDCDFCGHEIRGIYDSWLLTTNVAGPGTCATIGAELCGPCVLTLPDPLLKLLARAGLSLPGPVPRAMTPSCEAP